VILIVAFFVYRAGGPPALPAVAGSTETKSFFVMPGREEIFMKLLTNVIPGIDQTGREMIGNRGVKATEDLLAGIGWLDPRNPRALFAAQIPYLNQAGYRAESLLYQPAGGSGSETEQIPRIIVPAQATPRVARGRVIVYHTHTTESFVPTSGQRFTEDLEMTVARLGEELARLLEREHNLEVVHNREVHDLVRSTSYEVALGTLRMLLGTYPDAALVIDLHRDGVDRKITTARIDGQNAGRILFVVGSRHPNWQENYQKAMFLHEALEQLAPGLSRGVRERPLVYNQHLHPGSLLIEVGGHENSLEEVMRTLPYLASALAGLFE
jgi:stage II sporulation protein P